MPEPGDVRLATVSGTETTRPEKTLKPLDPPMVPFALGGIAVWLVALVITIPFRDTHESWFWICVAGALWGIPGLLTMVRYDARRKRRNEAAQP